MKKPYSNQDCDRLLWQTAALAIDAIISLRPVQEFLNGICKSCDFAPLWPDIDENK